MLVAVAPPILVKEGVRSIRPPDNDHSKACCWVAAVYENPTIVPESLIPLAALKSPPSEGSHCVRPDQRYASVAGELSGDPEPTMSLELLMAMPPLFVPTMEMLRVPLRRLQVDNW